MKKFLKILISTAATLFLAFIMFYCMVTGAPDSKSAAEIYMINAAIFAVLLSAFLCACIHYILYLQKKLEEKEKEA